MVHREWSTACAWLLLAAGCVPGCGPEESPTRDAQTETDEAGASTAPDAASSWDSGLGTAADTGSGPEDANVVPAEDTSVPNADDGGGSASDASAPSSADADAVPLDATQPIPDSGQQDSALEAGAMMEAGSAPDGSVEAGTQLPDASSGCSSDSDCPTHAYCARESATCTPRCDAHNGCVGPTISASNNRVVTDGVHVCYADDGEPAGGSTYSVRGWDGVAAQPTTLAQAMNARVLLVADGYCYYADPSLRRARLTGGGPTLVQELTSEPRRAWLTRDYVFWTSARDGQLDVYRFGRAAGGNAERIATVPATNLWEAGNSTHLFRRFNPMFGSCAIAMAPITDLSQETTIPMSFSKNCSAALWASEESIVFTQFEPAHYYPFRVDLANPSVEVPLRLHSVELLMYQVRGAWVYGQSIVDGSTVPGVPNTVSYQRATLAGGPTDRFFTPTPGTAKFKVEPYAFGDAVYTSFAVLAGRLVYQHLREHRLIAVPVPAEPSAAAQ